MTSDCPFCRLVSGEAEVSVVHEDERVVALMDIQPVVRGHLLLVPRSHAAYLADLDPEDGAQLFRVGQLAAVALRGSTLRCEGVIFFLADGEAAGQEVFHVHLHVFPRFRRRRLRPAPPSGLRRQAAHRARRGRPSAPPKLAEQRLTSLVNRRVA